MINERDYIVESFKNNFSMYKQAPLAIYGLGVNTLAVLEECSDYNIVGLLDAAREGEIVFGKEVYDLEQVYNRGVRTIVIIARASNVPIIYRRIAVESAKKGIRVFDINGVEQKKEKEDRARLEMFKNCPSKDNLLEQIDKHDVISFDVFDTLLVREVLEPRDVFYIMEQRLGTLFPMIDFIDFAGVRVSSENELYAQCNPTINRIYTEIRKHYSINQDIADSLIELELEIEREVLRPRTEMKQLFNDVLRRKEVCIVSDMYMTSDTIRDLLIQNGYNASNVPIYVSCEYNTSKCGDLYRHVVDAYCAKAILHIGDNRDADGICATNAGITDVFLIDSPYRMFGMSNLQEMLYLAKTVGERLLIGRIVSHYCNNPFLFSASNVKLQLDDEYAMGYYLIAPYVAAFLQWLIRECKEEGVDKLLLAARDGYLIKEIIDTNEKLKQRLPDYDYFYTSRSVCVKSAIKGERDIKSVYDIAFSGKVEELMNERFGVTKAELFTRDSDESDYEYLLRHIELILEKADKIRTRYMAYYSTLVSSNDKKVGFFDFVSSGTCQNALMNIIENEIVGFYFVHVFDSKKGDINVKALCQNTNIYEKECNLSQKYFFLENVFSSYEASMIDVSESGKPIFGEEKRDFKQFNSLRNIQSGIIDAVTELMDYGDAFDYSAEFADIILGTIDSSFMNITIDYFRDNPLYDEFCNRKFNSEDFI